MDRTEILQNGSAFLLNCFRDAMDKHYEEEMALAVARQKEEDACCAIAAFLEMKTPENEIMRLLSKFYGVDSITEATELVTTVKVENQANALYVAMTRSRGDLYLMKASTFKVLKKAYMR